jgi:nucleotide-binding universal stress UspA family protein
VTFKKIAVQLDSGTRSMERLGLAVRLAVLSGARLAGLFADSHPASATSGTGRRRLGWREASRAATSALHSMAREAGLLSEWWSVEEGELEPGRVAARFCRYADLVVVGQHDPEDPHLPADFAAHVMLESGRPVLVVPWIGTFREVGRRVVVAWDGSREAARALGDALPLMARADRVHVAMLGGESGRAGAPERTRPSVAQYLEAHGISARYEPVLVVGGHRNGAARDAILNLGAEVGADLVVMGARGRHGGPFPHTARRTRASLAAMTAPVLFSA